MKEIGGYFSFELPEPKDHYHPDALRLNTARNAMEYLLKVLNPHKVFIPYYNCSVMLEPFVKTGVPYEYYALDATLEIKEVVSLKKEEYLLYVNYFGVKNLYVKKLEKLYGKNLIVDNSQAFFSFSGAHAIYSPRKFFGVSDGAYLSGLTHRPDRWERDYSADRMLHLLGRLDASPHVYYETFKKNDDLLANQPILGMSALTERILVSVDYEQIKKKRNDNFHSLHEQLKQYNEFKIDNNSIDGPMVYPFLVNMELKMLLIRQSVYVATYWSDVLNIPNVPEVEAYMTQYLVPLPIDQRYGLEEMDQIADIVKRALNA